MCALENDRFNKYQNYCCRADQVLNVYIKILYAGTICDEEIDECLPGPCKNGGTCHDHINAYTCDCDQTGKKGLIKQTWL